ncbi:dephospho-CoA kinase [Futiania mangrovi]|uniref:Dephospho-CoA kinase n=1 Tax=Futiania mangrovi TaxID=2959716 RepID=A0A9J6PBC7_9PROT|nr:dephospho-CoA kinase [Futiania mangrovii]MCP1336493.1 dephospho-CoA kinase [Futiania mangrovii]
MRLVGLTGSIGMGKSTTAALFRAAGAVHYDADAAVHALYAPGGAAVGPIGAVFPQAIVENGVDRARLSEAVKSDPQALARLEAVVHPLVGRAQIDFLTLAERDRAEIVILDVPLLFETGGHTRVDAVVVVTAPKAVQRARVLERPGMTAEILDRLLARQTPDAEKRARADFLIETSRGIPAAQADVERVMEGLRHYRARAWSDRRRR